ncbi:MAG: hypothetical protein VX278_05925 [Myxococcota bacterium]|nr:hypothetical protein [Myxococcota bacterium]
MKPVLKSIRLALTSFLILWPLSSLGAAPKVTVVDGQFHTPSGAIPAGCFVQMKPQLNGDELIASVIIEVEGKSGCKNAKHPYPEPLQDPKAGPPSYSVLATLPEQVYQIKACEGVSGSMGKSCSDLLVQFSERSFGGRKALVVSHRGRGSALTSFDPKARVAEIREHYQAVAGNTKLKTKRIKSDCTNPGLTGEEPYGGRETLYRMVNGQVAEITDEISTLYGHESVQFLLMDGEIWFAFIQIRNESIPAMGIEFGYDTDNRLYFQKENLFLCKLTYPSDAPDGIRAGQNTEVPCSELHHIHGTGSPNEEQRVAEVSSFSDSIDVLLAHGKKLLDNAKANTHTGHGDWCKEGGSF